MANQRHHEMQRGPDGAPLHFVVVMGGFEPPTYGL